LLILRTLLFGPNHGHAIAKHIQRTSEDLLQVETGSLYPALHRLEQRQLVRAEWKTSDNNQRAKYYRLTAAGRRHLTREQSRWQQVVDAVHALMRPREQEG
jgi:transcriptional regulator